MFGLTCVYAGDMAPARTLELTTVDITRPVITIRLST
jgi:hypothetical protein